MGCIGLTGEVKKKELRLLLLGIAGSGKSTFSKQMMIIHQGGFDQGQTELYKQILMSNIIFGMKQLIEICQDNIAAENRKKARFIQSAEEITSIDAKMAGRIKTVWEDPAVQIAWKNRKESILIQLEYLLSHIDRVLAPDFIPTNDDILRARHRSTGELVSRFEDKKHSWSLVDVGGQFSERPKWEEVFEAGHINAVLYFIALDEYDIANVETTSEHDTKFQLAISIFEEVMNGPHVTDQKSCRIVFLNKLDLFKVKLEQEDRFVDFKNRFGYMGENQLELCIDCVKAHIEDKIADDLPVHIHAICGLDTNLIKKLAQDIKISIIASSLTDMGIL